MAIAATQKNEPNTSLTAESLRVFLLYARDAGNWSGNPWVSNGNIDCTKSMRGNLSDLTQKGLIEIDDAEGRNRAADMYVVFTPAGVELAAAHGIVIQ